jgi:hypothetical protein
MFEAPRPVRTATVGAADVAIGIPTGDGMDYQKILSVLWRGKTTILATIAASLLMAVLFVVLVPPLHGGHADPYRSNGFSCGQQRP